MKKDIEIIEKIQLTENQIKTGEIVKENTAMRAEEIDDLLMS